ncbi:unnamed protein product, partial [Effrenium voratum]
HDQRGPQDGVRGAARERAGRLHRGPAAAKGFAFPGPGTSTLGGGAERGCGGDGGGKEHRWPLRDDADGDQRLPRGVATTGDQGGLRDRGPELWEVLHERDRPERTGAEGLRLPQPGPGRLLECRPGRRPKRGQAGDLSRA